MQIFPLLLLLLALLSGCASIPTEGKYIDTFVLDAEVIGGKSSNISAANPSRQYTGRPSLNYELLESKSIEKYLDGIVASILKQWPGEPLDEPVKIYINSRPGYYAESTSCNDIVLSMGVLFDVDSEDELAFIIAHELSHILLHHHSDDIYFKQQKRALGTGRELATLSLQLQSVEFDENKKGTQEHQERQQKSVTNIKNLYKSIYLINQLSDNLVNTSISRRQERQADTLGVDLMVKAGYKADGYTSALERMASSVEVTEEALKEEKAQIGSLIYLATVDSIPSNVKYVNEIYLVGNRIISEILYAFSKDHDSYKDRKVMLGEYIQRLYWNEQCDRKLQTNNLNRTLRQGTTKRLLQHYKYASDAIKYLSKNEGKDAAQMAKNAVGSPTGNAAYPRIAYYSVRKEQGNKSKALANLKYIKNWEALSVPSLILASKSYSTAKQYKRALATLDKAGKVLGKPELVYPEKITVYKAANNNKKVLELYNQCRKFDEKDIRDKCDESVGSLLTKS